MPKMTNAAPVPALTMTERLAAVRCLIALGADTFNACKRMGMMPATFSRHERYRLDKMAAHHFITTEAGRDVACYHTLGEAVYAACTGYGINGVRHVDGTVVWCPGMSAEHAAELAPILRVEMISEQPDIS